MKTRKIMLIVSIFALLAMLLAACGGGPSPEEKAYSDAFVAALGNYNTKVKPAKEAWNQADPNNSDTIDQLKAAADELDQAADGLSNLPAAPAKYQKLDGLIKQLADQTKEWTQAMRNLADFVTSGSTDAATSQSLLDDYKAKEATIQSTLQELLAEAQSAGIQ